MSFNRDITINIAGNFIAGLEDFDPKTYLDDGGVPTIGYGTTKVNGKSVPLWLTCTKEQALKWLMDHLLLDAILLLKWCQNENVTLDNNQAASILSFTYNAGFDSFVHSTMAKQIKAGDFDSAAKAFLKWNKIRINGKLTFSKGLFNRRMAEEKCFIDEAAC